MLAAGIATDKTDVRAPLSRHKHARNSLSSDKSLFESLFGNIRERASYSRQTILPVTAYYVPLETQPLP